MTGQHIFLLINSFQNLNFFSNRFKMRESVNKICFSCCSRFISLYKKSIRSFLIVKRLLLPEEFNSSEIFTIMKANPLRIDLLKIFVERVMTELALLEEI